MRRGLKSDGHGNGGTLINGNGGTLINGNGETHYPFCIFRQPLSSYTGQLFALINIFWQQWNTFLVVSKVFFRI